MALQAEINDKRSRLLNRVTRHLPCNSPEALQVFGKTMDKVIDNITKDPHAVKFRQLRAANQFVSEKLLAVKGGREMLHLLGFELIQAHGESEYFLDKAEVGHLRQAREWLRNLISSTIGPNSTKGQPCADCVIRITLSSEHTLEGGFSLAEKGGDLMKFVHMCTADGEAEQFKLVGKNVVIGGDGGQENMEETLQSLGLGKKTQMAVVKTKTAVKQMNLARRNEEKDAAEELRLLKELSKKRKGTAEEEEKKRIMEVFRQDREKKQQQLDKERDEEGVEESKGSGY